MKPESVSYENRLLAGQNPERLKVAKTQKGSSETLGVVDHYDNVVTSHHILEAARRLPQSWTIPHTHRPGLKGIVGRDTASTGDAFHTRPS